VDHTNIFCHPNSSRFLNLSLKLEFFLKVSNFLVGVYVQPVSGFANQTIQFWKSDLSDLSHQIPIRNTRLVRSSFQTCSISYQLNQNLLRSSHFGLNSLLFIDLCGHEKALEVYISLLE
jgi:hypothetical protein